LTKKIIKEKSSLYRNEPKREFLNVSEDQLSHILNLYNYSQANLKLKKTNEIYKLQDQAMLQAVLKDGVIELRPLYHHHYDVIPSGDNPEKMECVIMSSFDKWRLFSMNVKGDVGFKPTSRTNYYSDFNNQLIADPDDYKAKTLFYWWTDKFNFITNSKGEIVDKKGVPQGNPRNEFDPLVANPIMALPFIDVAMDKDFEFFVRSGYSSTTFSIDLGALLSDTSEIARMQGWSQAIISSVDEPKDIRVGPRNALWLKLNPNDTEATRPSFEFTSPNPDLEASLQLIENFMSLYLTSEGLSPSVINSQGRTETATSGLDRWLKMIEKFESSQDDADLFKTVEKKLFDLIKKWNNTYANVTENGFIDDLSGVLIPDNADVLIQYKKPQMLMGEDEKLNVIQKRLDMGLISQIEAIQIDRDVTREKAEEIYKEVNSLLGIQSPNAETE
jgi:hypothetical protein